MATRAEIKQKLQIALQSKFQKISEARVNNEIQSDIQISEIVYIEPSIILPVNIDKDDFEKAEEIDFERAQIRLKKGEESNVYYCDGKAKLRYLNNDFDIIIEIANIYLL